jgi:hypothetical protein
LIAQRVSTFDRTQDSTFESYTTALAKQLAFMPDPCEKYAV